MRALPWTRAVSSCCSPIDGLAGLPVRRGGARARPDLLVGRADRAGRRGLGRCRPGLDERRRHAVRAVAVGCGVAGARDPDVREGRLRAPAVLLVGQRRRAGVAGRSPGPSPGRSTAATASVSTRSGPTCTETAATAWPGTATGCTGSRTPRSSPCSASAASAASSCGRRAAAPASGSSRHQAICWSWAARASGPGSTACRRRLGSAGRASACRSVTARVWAEEAA